MVGPRRPLFVLFGSSIVQYSFANDGWGAALADIYSRKADILVRGYSAWNSRRALQVMDQIFPKDDSQQPSLIIVYFGGNDSIGPHASGLGPHVPLSEYIDNIRKIATYLQDLSESTRLIFLSCPPVNEDMLNTDSRSIFSHLVRTNEACRHYSEACIQVCKEMDLKVVDLWSAIQTRPDWRTSCFTDGIHFSAEGSIIVVDQILKVLKEAEWEPSLHWNSIPAEFGESSPYDLVASDNESTINVSEFTFHREKQWD